jgi:hypothetical protein
MELTMPPSMLVQCEGRTPRGCWSNAKGVLPEDVSPIQGAVPRTEETHDGEGTSVLESNKEQEVTDAGRLL